MYKTIIGTCDLICLLYFASLRFNKVKYLKFGICLHCKSSNMFKHLNRMSKFIHLIHTLSGVINLHFNLYI